MAGAEMTGKDLFARMAQSISESNKDDAQALAKAVVEKDLL